MKRGFYSIFILLGCCMVMSGCIKNTPYVTTLNPYLTAQIGTYNFTAKTVVPTVGDTQSHVHDTAEVLYITGNASDILYPYDKIILSVSRYKGKMGTLSIVQGQAGAVYIHQGISYPAIGGIVAITKVTSNSLIGYFSFQTASGITVTNGAFNVGKPWNY